MTPEEQATIAEWAAGSKTSRPWQTLQDALDELERTDPKVREASERYDSFVLGESYRYRLYEGINERRASEGKPPIGPFVKREARGEPQIQPPTTP